MDMMIFVTISKAFAAAITMMTMYGISNGISNALSAIVGAMAKNPAVKEDLRAFGMLGLLMTELCGLLVFATAMAIIFTL